MRITFIIGSLSSGGAERVLISLTKGFVKREHRVSVVTLNGKEMDFYELPKGVQRLTLDVYTPFQVLLKFPALRWSLLSTEPDVIISFTDRMNIITLCVTRGLNVPVVVSERTDPQVYSIGIIWRQLRQWTYPFADRIVVQTWGASNYFLPRFQSKVCIIPNPVLVPTVNSLPMEPLPKPSVMAMGRFYPQKGFDLLLRAFAQVKNRHPEWKLVILGEGPLRRELESLRNALGLADCVDLPGRVKNPYDLLKQADLFVLSSRFEGFPNALCEAMACGLPVIATDCPSGPREIIRDGVDGILVQNQDIVALSNAMDQMMSDEDERKCLASRAAEVTERFSIGKVIGRWEEILFQILDERKGHG